METIRVLKESDLNAFVTIMANAYPGIGLNSEKDREEFKKKMLKVNKLDKRTRLYGLFQNKDLIGEMRLFDYTMNLFGAWTPVGGIGSVAVDLCRKKEHAAKKMLLYFLNLYRRKKTAWAVLWPFRPDFYKKMGFGIVAKMHLYDISPDSLPSGQNKKHVRFLSKEDMGLFNQCYNRAAARTNGMIKELKKIREHIFDIRPQWKYAGFFKNKELLGYMIFTFERGQENNLIDNNIKVLEMVYETPEALNGLLNFLNTQFDQINRILLHTTDEDFYFLLKDPRNSTKNIMPPVYHESHAIGVGAMYRVIHVAGAFESLKRRDFNRISCGVKFRVKDSFLKANHGSVVVRFSSGKARVQDKKASYDVEVALDVADLSSLLMGAVTMNSLYNYGLVKLSDPKYLKTLNQLFYTKDKPACFTWF